MSRFLFSQAMEISHDMAIVVDLEGRITYANPAAGEVLGCRSEEIRGQFLWDILKDLDQIGRIMEMTLEYGQWGGEVVCRRKGGNGVPIRLRTVLIQSKEGETLGVVGMGWDLTAQKEMEAQLVRFERQRLLGEMAGGVAHNFNNILTGILGHSRILREDRNIPPESRDVVRIILESAEKGAELVRRIQESAKGACETVPAPILLNDVVVGCLETTRPRWKNQADLEGRPIELEVDLRASRPVDGRISEVDEVLTNLVFNAVDAMPEGGKIRIRTWDEDETVVLSVSDTGVGMDRKVRSRLGELFFTTKGDRGHGLGLAVCYRIVEKMSGRVEVESTPGRGTTFTLLFPARKAVGTRRRPTVPGLPALCKILVVEDEEQIRGFLRRVLSGYRVETAGDGEAGVALFREGRHDVVLLDLSMPGMNGVEVARQIRDIDPGVRIVLMSGWGGQPEGTADLFQAFLTKPFSPQDLNRCLAEAVGDAWTDS